MSEYYPTEADGEEVLRAAVHAAVELLGEDLDAAFAIGSLAHGGFAPLVSDVDLALVLRTVSSESDSRIARIAEQVRTGGPMAQRLSVFWSDWAGVRGEGQPAGRLPQVDRLDLMDSGRLLYGTDRRDGGTLPGHDELVLDAARFAATRFDQAYLESLLVPEQLLSRGVRPVTKAVLFPVRFLYTLHTGKLGLNEHAATWYRGRPSEPLVSAALRWRLDGLTDPGEARELLEKHLPGLYREFFAEYSAARDGVEGPTGAKTTPGTRRVLDPAP